LHKEIAGLADRYAVSREVLLRRLLIFNRTTKGFYQKKRRQFVKEYEELRKLKAGGFAPHYRLAISTAGPLFIRLVFDSYYQEKITASDLSSFLNVKLKHVGRIEGEVMGLKTLLGATA
jgi:Zn-dependent peptidase ImmA (M78 family)